jgi:hypothetical protein
MGDRFCNGTAAFGDVACLIGSAEDAGTFVPDIAEEVAGLSATLSMPTP